MDHQPGCPGPLHCLCPMPAPPTYIVQDVGYEVGDVVLAHQKNSEGKHRLVLCCTPPQKAGEWTNCNLWATVDGYRASWDKGVEGGKLSPRC